MKHRRRAAQRRNPDNAAKSVVVRPSPIHGSDVFAARRFRPDELILQPDESRVLVDPDVLPEEERKYCYDLPDKSVLWPPPERYINHSCEPNAYVKTEGGARAVLAMREIKRDEEITLDYRLDGFSDCRWDCNCGTRRCSGVCDENFFRLPKALQLEYLPYLDAWFVAAFRQRVDSLRGEAVGRAAASPQRRNSSS